MATTRHLAWAAAVVLLLALAVGSRARTLSLVRAAGAPAYSVADELVSASDGRRWVYLRRDALSIRAIDASTGVRRDGHRLAVVARRDPVVALGLQAVRAAWIAGTRLRLYDVRNGRSAVYRLPSIGPTLQPRKVVQTDGRVLVELDSTAVGGRVAFYEGTVPQALRGRG